MKIVTFPLINLTCKLNPIAITLFGVSIYWYAVIIVASILLAFFLCYRKRGTFGISYDTILDLSLILIPVAFICARLYYVIFAWEQYTNISQIFNIKDGGLAIYGGMIGGAITIYFFCKKRKIAVLDILDYLVPYLALGQCLGRWGNFINVEAYGRVTNVPWKMGIVTKDMVEYVHPTFLYESIATLCIFFILSRLSKKRKFKGEITYVYLILYSFVRFLIEGLRSDSLMFYQVRISQILSSILFVIFCGILIDKIENNKKSTVKKTKSMNKSHDY